ncbi:hypothetical protein Barb6_02491 [Bacteroidales bacterium Barb6]|nr:hypothetical protein Barb6_02491 [Bacteroidales bacterium Barb6]
MNQSITERVKSYEDACAELGLKPVSDDFLKWHGFTKDEIAYKKLKVVTEALNEGWAPKFFDTEWRYFPWFYVKTVDGKRILSRSYNIPNTSGVDTYAGDSSGSWCAGSSRASRLALKTRELAIYAAETFETIYSDYLLL